MATKDGPRTSVLCAKIHELVIRFATRSYEWILGARQRRIVLYKKLQHFKAKMLFFCITQGLKQGCAGLFSIYSHPLDACGDNPVVWTKEDKD
jgi:hypothetical protein